MQIKYLADPSMHAISTCAMNANNSLWIGQSQDNQVRALWDCICLGRLGRARTARRAARGRGASTEGPPHALLRRLPALVAQIVPCGECHAATATVTAAATTRAVSCSAILPAAAQIVTYKCAKGEKFRQEKRKTFRGHNTAGYACGVGFSPDGK